MIFTLFNKMVQKVTFLRQKLVQKVTFSNRRNTAGPKVRKGPLFGHLFDTQKTGKTPKCGFSPVFTDQKGDLHSRTWLKWPQGHAFTVVFGPLIWLNVAKRAKTRVFRL